MIRERIRELLPFMRQRFFGKKKLSDKFKIVLSINLENCGKWAWILQRLNNKKKPEKPETNCSGLVEKKTKAIKQRMVCLKNVFQTNRMCSSRFPKSRPKWGYRNISNFLVSNDTMIFCILNTHSSRNV